jgi:hypothetical protein
MGRPRGFSNTPSCEDRGVADAMSIGGKFEVRMSKFERRSKYEVRNYSLPASYLGLELCAVGDALSAARRSMKPSET